VGRATRQVPLVYVPVHSNSSFSVSNPSSIGSLVHHIIIIIIIIIISSLQGSFDDNPTRGKRWPSLTNPDLVWCEYTTISQQLYWDLGCPAKESCVRLPQGGMWPIMYHGPWVDLHRCLSVAWQSIGVHPSCASRCFACKPATCYWRGTLVFPVHQSETRAALSLWMSPTSSACSCSFISCLTISPPCSSAL